MEGPNFNSRNIYNTFKDIYFSLNLQDIRALRNWETILNFNNIDWATSFLNAHHITTDTKLKVFQYKILHRILPSNKTLFKHMCDFCKDQEYLITIYGNVESQKHSGETFRFGVIQI